MQEYLPFIIVGIVTGSIYGLAGTGLVLTYRTSGIFNFAHGAVAAAAAYFFYWLNVVHGISWLPALLLSICVLGPAAGLGLQQVAKRLAVQRPAMKIVGTVGIILLVEGLATVKFGTEPLVQPQFFPHGSSYFALGGTNVSYAQVIVSVVPLVAVIALYLLLKFTRSGIAMRAVVDDPDLLSLHGTSPRRVRSAAWLIGTTFAVLSGVLVGPTAGIEAITLTYLVVQAFGAAAIGTFSNLPMTYIGGLILGIASSLSTKFTLNVPWLNGLPGALPFLILFIALVVTPRRRLAMPTRLERPPAVEWRGPPLGRLLLGGAIIVLFVLVPVFAGGRLAFYTVGLTQGIMLLSLGLLVRTAGLVSLSQAAFAAIGAVCFSQFFTDMHMPWLLAVLAGALVVAPVAGLLAIPAIRLSGLFLALATFGFGLMIVAMFYTRNFMFTPATTGRIMPRPSIARTDSSYYFIVLAFLIGTAGVVELIHRGRLGRLLHGLSQSPLSINTLGLNVNATRALVFCISGFIAGIGGILYGCTVNVASSGDAHYGSFESLVLLALLALAPMRAPWYALFGVVGAVIPAYWTSADSTSWLYAIFGLFAVIVALQGGTTGLPASVRTRIWRFLGGWQPRVRRRSGRPDPASAEESPDVAVPVPSAGLRINGMSVRYGGNVAVGGLTLKAPAGRITGLIGPNGAGKTTTFNVASGLIKPSSGTVTLDNRDVTGASPAARGCRGLGRTFQIMQLCDSLTVYDNVLLGCEAAQAGARPWHQLLATPSEFRIARQQATEALDLCGIRGLADSQAGDLSTGERRLVDLARCLAGSFDILLLDEPSSGLDPSETERFAQTLKQAVSQRGTGILLVEHDMSLVMDVCDYIYVLDFGRLLFEGPPQAVSSSEIVQNAYLGTAAVGATAGNDAS